MPSRKEMEMEPCQRELLSRPIISHYPFKLGPPAEGPEAASAKGSKSKSPSQKGSQ